MLIRAIVNSVVFLLFSIGFLVFFNYRCTCVICHILLNVYNFSLSLLLFEAKPLYQIFCCVSNQWRIFRPQMMHEVINATGASTSQTFTRSRSSRSFFWFLHLTFLSLVRVVRFTRKVTKVNCERYSCKLFCIFITLYRFDVSCTIEETSFNRLIVLVNILCMYHKFVLN